MFVASLIAPAVLAKLVVHALNRQYAEVHTYAPPSPREIELESCPLKFFVDGLPGSFTGTVIHEESRLFLAIPNCDDRLELTVSNTDGSPRESNLKRFLSVATAEIQDQALRSVQPRWRYEVRASVLGELSVQSDPPGYRKDYDGEVFDPSGRVVGSYPLHTPVRFAFRLRIKDASDIRVKVTER
jgi:hypothetical protein